MVSPDDCLYDAHELHGCKKSLTLSILETMDYAWVSGVVVLVILVILLLGWLPRRTVDSMKKVVEHREDKYSPSLHLVDAESGTRFSDERQSSAKGIVMQSERKGIVASPSGASVARTAKAMKERARVARIRRLRREAARRRAIVSAALLLVTIVVLAVSFPLRFSPLFALIPAVLLALVVALGVRTANHARAWERDLKVKRAAQAKAGQSQRGRSAAVANGQTAKTDNRVANEDSMKPVSSDEQPTGLMAEQEIAKAVKQTRAEKERIENRRSKSKAESVQSVAASESRTKNEDTVKASKSTGKAAKGETKSDNAMKSSKAKNQSAVQPESPSVSVRHSKPKTADASVSAKNTGKTSKPANRRQDDAAANAHASGKADYRSKKQQVEPSDATNELKRVHPAQALDVVDLAPNQDLISFSLGAPRNGVDVKSEEPESLEIKSTRQVAKAEAMEKGSADSSSSASKQAKESSAQASENKPDGSARALSATSVSETGHAQEQASKLISMKNRKRARAASRRGHTLAQRNGKKQGEKTGYTNDPEKFHASEVSADTEAPAKSSDSLGTGLEKILERRNV